MANIKESAPVSNRETEDNAWVIRELHDAGFPLVSELEKKVYGRKKLSPTERAIFWFMRIYVIAMGAAVVVQVIIGIKQ